MVAHFELNRAGNGHRPPLYFLEQGGSGPPPPPFSPTDISNLLWWLDGTDSNSMTLDGSNGLSLWTDKSGQGNNASQGTALSRPVFLINQLLFNGVSQEVRNTTNPHLISDNPWTLCLVFKAALLGDFQGLLSMTTLSNTANRAFGLGFAQSTNTSYADFYFGNLGTEVPSLHGTIPSPKTNWHYLILTHLSSGNLPANFSTVIDAATITMASTANAAPQLGRIGNDDNGFFQGALRCILFYGKAVSGVELGKLEAYLNGLVALIGSGAPMLITPPQMDSIAAATKRNWKKAALIAGSALATASAIGAALYYFL